MSKEASDAPDAGRAAWGRFALSSGQEAQLERLLAVVAGDERAPTTIRDPERAAAVHVADSLAALDLPQSRTARTVVDIGSGAGFPGLPLAVALPGADVALVESQRRKCDFLEAARRALEVRNARVICARVEEWREGAAAFDLAVARAVGPQPVVLEYAAPLLRVGGALLDWRGRRDPADEEAALRAASELGMERLLVERTQPLPAADAHHVHVFEKRSKTPARYPRRAGMARKRPLGS